MAWELTKPAKDIIKRMAAHNAVMGTAIKALGKVKSWDQLVEVAEAVDSDCQEILGLLEDLDVEMEEIEEDEDE